VLPPFDSPLFEIAGAAAAAIPENAPGSPSADRELHPPAKKQQHAG